MIPGFTGSSPGHWQSIWEREHPEYRRVTQRDWDDPVPEEWVAAVNNAIVSTKGPIYLAGHSLGCVTIAKWATAHGPGNVQGAFLVAPTDVEALTAPIEVRDFAPIPLDALPFESLVVASTNDPLVSIARARLFARSWGSRFISIGVAGHIHTAAGYGPWPEGHALLREMIGE